MSMFLVNPPQSSGQGLFSAGNAFGQAAGNAYQQQAQWLQQNQPNYDGAPKLPGVDDFSADRQRIEQSMFGRARGELDQRYSQETDAFNQRMANEGVDIGSVRYQREKALFDKSRNEAYNDAQFRSMLAGGEEQSRLFGMGLQSRQQSVAESDALRNSRREDMASLVNPAMQMEGFLNQRAIADKQDLTQRYGIDKNFEASGLDRTSRETMQRNQQDWQGGQNTLDRDQRQALQNQDLDWQRQSQRNQFDFTAGQNTLERDFTAGQNTLGREHQTFLQNDNQKFTKGQNAEDRKIQQAQIRASMANKNRGGGQAAMDPAQLLGLIEALTGERLSG